MEKDGGWASSASVEWNKRIESYGIRIEVGGFGLDPVKSKSLERLSKKIEARFMLFCISLLSLSLSVYHITEKRKEKEKEKLVESKGGGLYCLYSLGT